MGAMSARCRGLKPSTPGNDRRQALAMLLSGGLARAALGAPRQASAGATQMAPLPGGEHFMRIAIAEAAKADFPFGALIVRDGEVVSTGRNWAQPPTIRRHTAKWWDPPLRRGAARRRAPGHKARADHADQPAGGGRSPLRHGRHYRRGGNLVNLWNFDSAAYNCPRTYCNSPCTLPFHNQQCTAPALRDPSIAPDRNPHSSGNSSGRHRLDLPYTLPRGGDWPPGMERRSPLSALRTCKWRATNFSWTPFSARFQKTATFWDHGLAKLRHLPASRQARRTSRACLPQGKSRRERRAGDRDQG